MKKDFAPPPKQTSAQESVTTLTTEELQILVSAQVGDFYFVFLICALSLNFIIFVKKFFENFSSAEDHLCGTASIYSSEYKRYIQFIWTHSGKQLSFKLAVRR